VNKERRWITFFAGGLLIATFLCVNLYLAADGVRPGGDAFRYISGAEHLLDGQTLEGDQRRYAGYIAVVAASDWVGAGLAGVVALQLTAAAAAAVALFDLGRQLKGLVAGWVATFLFVANLDLAQWHFYVMTDSLYISAVVFMSWGLARVLNDRRDWWLLMLLAIAAASLRPHGWLLIPIAAACILATFLRGRAGRWPAAAGLAATLVLAIALLPFTGAGEHEEPAEMLRLGEVVGRLPEWRLEMPEDARASGTGWRVVADYAVHHPTATARLAVARVAAELAHLRPGFSNAHNLAIVAVLLPQYLTAVLGVRRTHRPDIAAMLLVVIAVHFTVVAITFANWDGRFLLYVLPSIGLFSGCGVAYVLERLRPRGIPLLNIGPDFI